MVHSNWKCPFPMKHTWSNVTIFFVKLGHFNLYAFFEIVDVQFRPSIPRIETISSINPFVLIYLEWKPSLRYTLSSWYKPIILDNIIWIFSSIQLAILTLLDVVVVLEGLSIEDRQWTYFDSFKLKMSNSNEAYLKWFNQLPLQDPPLNLLCFIQIGNVQFQWSIPEVM